MWISKRKIEERLSIVRELSAIKEELQAIRSSLELQDELPIEFFGAISGKTHCQTSGGAYKEGNFHHLKVISKEHGWVVILDDTELHGVESYKVESCGSGKAKLVLEMMVKHP